ncbi:MAG: biosynthetic-type acetolactate synthase large subunit [Cyanobacteria bacterium SIG28]|nr:biosynthetic-type acetolactate synthase large subunit [Cyanobacteria bacterium SIG28]
MYNNNAMANLVISDQKFTQNRIYGTKMLTCAKALVEALEEIHVDSIFGYPGAAVLSVYNELSNSKIRHYLVRHEQAAVHSAEGYARVSNKPGIVLVTSGPGITNTITGIANAYADSTPLVVLAGDVASNNNKGKIFQKVDIVSMTKTCCKKSYTVTSKDDIKQIVKEAYEVANSGEKGPVIVVLPRNILESKYTAKITKDLHKKKPSAITDNDYNKTLKLIDNAKSPLILLGGGAINAVEDIKKLVYKTNIPVISTLMGIGTFPSDDKMYLGMIGINGTCSANTALNNSDLIIAFGVSFSDRTTCKRENFAQNAKIVNINIKKTLNNFELEVCTDAQTFAKGLLERLNEEYNFKTWNNQVKIIKEENSRVESSSECLHSSCVLETIYEYTKKYEPVVVTDVGQHQLLTAQFFNFNKPNKFITSGGLGTMGFGLPAAIGAQLAKPASLVLNITGDGSFQMNLQELATCREHNIPVKIIIMNNGYLGMVRQLQDKIYNNRYQVEMINPDFTKIAEAYELFAVRVKTAEELIPALQKAISYQGTAIIDIAINAFEEI